LSFKTKCTRRRSSNSSVLLYRKNAQELISRDFCCETPVNCLLEFDNYADMQNNNKPQIMLHPLYMSIETHKASNERKEESEGEFKFKELCHWEKS